MVQSHDYLLLIFSFRYQTENNNFCYSLSTVTYKLTSFLLTLFTNFGITLFLNSFLARYLIHSQNAERKKIHFSFQYSTQLVSYQMLTISIFILYCTLKNGFFITLIFNKLQLSFKNLHAYSIWTLHLFTFSIVIIQQSFKFFLVCGITSSPTKYILRIQSFFHPCCPYVILK